VGCLHPFAETLEFASDYVRAEADALVAEGQKADAQSALGEAGALDLGRLLDEAGELPIGQLEVADGYSVTVDGDLRAAAHPRILADPRDT
jgi:hypothetical protein